MILVSVLVDKFGTIGAELIGALTPVVVPNDIFLHVEVPFLVIPFLVRRA